MRLTLHADYALRVLLLLAVRPPGDVVSVGDIAAAYGVSANHLTKVAQRLASLGYVELLRGVRGGVRLAKQPEHIRIGEVVRQTEPSLAVLECFDPEENTCPVTPACGLKDVVAEATARFFEVLDGATLADAARRRQGLVKLLSPKSLVRAR